MKATTAVKTNPLQPDRDDLGCAETEIDTLFEDWATWSRSRRFAGAFVRSSRGSDVRSNDAKGVGSTSLFELVAVHLGIISQPPEALDRRVFEMHYFTRPTSIKAAAHAMGISPAHWYRLMKSFKRRVYAASRELLVETASERGGVGTDT